VCWRLSRHGLTQPKCCSTPSLPATKPPSSKHWLAVPTSTARRATKVPPLIAAALDDQLAIAEFLLSKGADVMARNSGGFTPLHAAAFSGSLPIARLLLEQGAVLEDSANKSGVTPLVVAGEENHVELAEFLIAQGADVNRAEAHGYWPTTRAFWKGNTDIIKLFKRHGATCQAKVLGEANAAKCAAIHD
jgi:ankyrin repeat protein